MEQRNQDRWRLMFETRVVSSSPVKKAKNKREKKKKKVELLPEYELTKRSLEILIDNCLKRTPVTHRYVNYRSWYADNRTIKFKCPRQSGKTMAAINLAIEKALNPLFVGYNYSQIKNLQRQFNNNKLKYCTKEQIERNMQVLQPDWIIIEDPMEEFKNINDLYGQAAPALQLLIILS